MDSNQISVCQQILDSMSGYVPGILFSNQAILPARQYILQYVMGGYQSSGTLASVLYIVLLVGIILALPVMTKIEKRNTMAIGEDLQSVLRMVSTADYFRKDDCYCSFCNCRR